MKIRVKTKRIAKQVDWDPTFEFSCDSPELCATGSDLEQGQNHIKGSVLYVIGTHWKNIPNRIEFVLEAPSDG